MELQDRRVVVTGKIGGESRATAEQKLREAGAIVQSSVTRETEVLITGGSVGKTKTNRAYELGVDVVPWEEVWNPSGGTVVVAEEPRPAPDRVRQIAPQLCYGVEEVPTGDEWLFEVKWDGYRCVAIVHDGEVTMQSRAGLAEYSGQFPKIHKCLVEAANRPAPERLPDCILDGELVVLDQNGVSSFGLMHKKGEAVYVLYDILEMDGTDLRSVPFQVRRRLLDKLGGLDRVTISPLFEDGVDLLEKAKKHGLEGIVAKRKRAVYREGSRNGDWLKLKIRNQQEFVVVGTTQGTGRLSDTVGSLILAVHDGERLVHCGSVGTGFTDAKRDELRDKLTPCETPGGSYELDVSDWAPATRNAARWVEPELVVQVEFQRWTEDGMLFHPAFLGERDDKEVADVRREP